MKNYPSKKTVLVRTILFGPLLLSLIYSFSTKETIKVPNGNSDFYHEVIQEKVSQKMMEEYNELVSHFSAHGLSREDVESASYKRMVYIFDLMTPEQKKTAIPMPPAPPVIPNAEPVPPLPSTPSHVDAIKTRIKQGAQFYLNGKKISNEEALELFETKIRTDFKVKVEEKDPCIQVYFSDN